MHDHTQQTTSFKGGIMGLITCIISWAGEYIPQPKEFWPAIITAASCALAGQIVVTLFKYTVKKLTKNDSQEEH